MKMSKKHTGFALLAAALLAAGTGLYATRNDFGLGRNMEIVVNMMRELSLFYVDEVDPDRLTEAAADGMARILDPYTEFMPEEQLSAFDLMTTGKYGGVGSLIRKKGEWVIFAQPYEGSPADRAGIRIGDRILAIDGESARGVDPDWISSRLKGTPDTEVEVVIERLLGGAVDTLRITRERVSIPSVPYAGFVAPGIGYVRHDDFTEGSYEAMRTAIEGLMAQDSLRGLILDYRQNGGGLLPEAVKILSMFVPKGTEVVSMRGRSAESQRIVQTEQEPILADLPLAVLINAHTASSSEIVAGALQDLDRAVLVGQRSYGKGLVQSTRPLAYNTLLKLTTARYYTPSGRCIQAIDYSSHRADGRAERVADSLVTEYRTRAGRKVYDGGGITPDEVMAPEYISRFAVTLYALGFIEDFVDDYMQRNAGRTIDPATFSITEADYADFARFLEGKEIPYESQTRRALRTLQQAAGEERYDEALAAEIAALEAKLPDDTPTNLRTYREEIIRTINSDVVLRHAYQRGVIAHSLPDDGEVMRAVEILEDVSLYAEILRSRDTQRTTDEAAGIPAETESETLPEP